jgi:hypothetical protein
MVPGRIEQGMTCMPRSQNWYNCLHLPAYQRGQVSSFCSLHHVKAPSNFLAGVRLCKEMTLIVKSRAVMEGNSKGIIIGNRGIRVELFIKIKFFEGLDMVATSRKGLRGKF